MPSVSSLPQIISVVKDCSDCIQEAITVCGSCMSLQPEQHKQCAKRKQEMERCILEVGQPQESSLCESKCTHACPGGFYSFGEPYYILLLLPFGSFVHRLLTFSARWSSGGSLHVKNGAKHMANHLGSMHYLRLWPCQAHPLSVKYHIDMCVCLSACNCDAPKITQTFSRQTF